MSTTPKSPSTMCQPPLISRAVTNHLAYYSGPQPIILDPSEWGGSGSSVHLGAYAWDWELEQSDQIHNKPHAGEIQRSLSLVDRIVRNMREQLEEQYSLAKKSRMEKMRSNLRDVDIAIQLRCHKAYQAVRRRHLSPRKDIGRS